MIGPTILKQLSAQYNRTEKNWFQKEKFIFHLKRWRRARTA